MLIEQKHKYKYKEPETWDELFDALDAVSTTGFKICPEVRKFFRVHNPINISAAVELWRTNVSSTGSLAWHVMSWQDHLVHGLTGKYIPYWKYFEQIANKPTPYQLRTLRHRIKVELKKAAKLYP